jgi:hypothetical protein
MCTRDSIAKSDSHSSSSSVSSWVLRGRFQKNCWARRRRTVGCALLSTGLVVPTLNECVTFKLENRKRMLHEAN